MDQVLAERVAAVATAVDALLLEDLSAASDDAVLTATRELEAARRRLELSTMLWSVSWTAGRWSDVSWRPR